MELCEAAAPSMAATWIDHLMILQVLLLLVLPLQQPLLLSNMLMTVCASQAALYIGRYARHHSSSLPVAQPVV